MYSTVFSTGIYKDCNSNHCLLALAILPDLACTTNKIRRSFVRIFHDSRKYFSDPMFDQLAFFCERKIYSVSHHFFADYHYHLKKNNDACASYTCVCSYFTKNFSNLLFLLLLFLCFSFFSFFFFFFTILAIGNTNLFLITLEWEGSFYICRCLSIILFNVLVNYLHCFNRFKQDNKLIN